MKPVAKRMQFLWAGCTGMIDLSILQTHEHIGGTPSYDVMKPFNFLFNKLRSREIHKFEFTNFAVKQFFSGFFLNAPSTQKPRTSIDVQSKNR